MRSPYPSHLVPVSYALQPIRFGITLNGYYRASIRMLYSPRPILYLVPDLLGPHGDISRYCRMVSRTLVEQGRRLTAIALMDRPGSHPDALMSSGLLYPSCSVSRPALVREALPIALRQRSAVVIEGHAAPPLWHGS